MSFIISQASSAKAEVAKNLSNSDFRELLAQNRDRERHEVAAPAEDTEISKARAKKKAASFQRWQQKKAHFEQLKEKKDKYIDRAKDRRKKEKEGDKGGEDDDKEEEFQKVDKNKNKYLGGDLEHTHLVHGLDYQLLERVRAAGDKDDDDELEHKMEERIEKKVKEIRSGAGGSELNEIKYSTALARSIYRTAIENEERVKVDLFKPGRMLYQFDLCPWVYDGLPTTLLQSQSSEDRSQSDKVSGFVEGALLTKLGKIMSFLHGPSEKKKRRKKKLSTGGAAEEGSGSDAEPVSKPTPMATASSQNSTRLPLNAPPSRQNSGPPIDEDIFANAPALGAGGVSLHQAERERAQQRSTATPAAASALSGQPVAPLPTENANYFRAGPESGPTGTASRARDATVERAKQLPETLPMSFEGRKGPLRGPREADDEDLEALLSSDAEKAARAKALEKTTKSLSDDYYAEAYPTAGYSFAIDDSDEEDLTTLDKNGKVTLRRSWEFNSEAEWEKHQMTREATPKAAFQFGLKMKDGRKGKGKALKDGNNGEDTYDPDREAKKAEMRFEREFQQVTQLMKEKRKGMPKVPGGGGAPVAQLSST